MPQLDPSSYASQAFWLLVSFVVLYLVVSRLVVPRMAEVMESRRVRIDGNIERASALKKEAESALAAYEKALTQARTEAHGIVSEAAARMAETAAKQEAEQAKRLAARVAEGEAAITQAVAKANAELDAVAADVAAAAAGRLLGEPVDAAAAKAAVGAVLKSRG